VTLYDSATYLIQYHSIQVINRVFGPLCGQYMKFISLRVMEFLLPSKKMLVYTDVYRTKEHLELSTLTVL
jgi:hypothetical protein